MDKNGVIELIQIITDKLEQGIESSNSLVPLMHKQNLLIIKSARDEYYNDFIHNIKELDPLIEYFLVEEEHSGIRDTAEIEYHIRDRYFFNERISEDFVEEFKKNDVIKRINTVVFLTNGLFKRSYNNVYSLVDSVVDYSGAEVYAYHVSEHTLNKLNDFHFFYECMIGLPGMISILDALFGSDVLL